MHDCTLDSLFSGVHHGTGEALTLPVRRQAGLACRLDRWLPEFEHSHYGYCDLAAEEHLVADQSELGAELIITHTEERFARKHARVTRRLELAGAMEIKEDLPDDDSNGELHGD